MGQARQISGGSGRGGVRYLNAGGQPSKMLFSGVVRTAANDALMRLHALSCYFRVCFY